MTRNTVWVYRFFISCDSVYNKQIKQSQLDCAFTIEVIIIFITLFIFSGVSFNLRQLTVEFVKASKTVSFFFKLWDRGICVSDHITPASHHSETRLKQTFWVHSRGRTPKSTKAWRKNPFAVLHDAKVTSDDLVTWHGIWREIGGSGGGIVGMEMRRGGGKVWGEVKSLIVWHHIGSYILREWSQLHFTSNQRAAKETETQEAAAAAAWLSAPLQPLSAFWPLTLWTRLICRCIHQCWNRFFFFGVCLLFFSSRCRHSWLVCFSSVSHVAHFAQVSNKSVWKGFCVLL